ncbi:hypothetical protein Mkiyose1665_25170 [Mycobacterium kiyosense]|uniref:Uncharacterized protein n=1 Tax=Mycobacterium kiyosense TaxID=2871094 RepID=A0A9P3Q560_9MYCO|nr:hypothetical protein IWGMT90018_52500 [Mycobacterium kiyosense]BDE16293.1 hypothetical protein MKCMC460_51530 [Mycobacterium sp. 20KCMC460]GLB83558.1 hypothetical protein SRL2020028_28140 [Mycobacterium kiyosense]GLB89492.1 hypothetical protein SRL2020130_23090 [Mycobacterium kiyosense]GLB94990.1 hypothetical protein SRL2020226_17660 [Mycobacterium kiyosense]
MITPETVVIAKTMARNPTATQNNRSVCHQPAIRSVATTEVAQPLTMLTALAATAVRASGAGGNRPGSGGTPVRASKDVGLRGSWVVGGDAIGGSGAVGARLMIRVRGSSVDSCDSGAAASAGSFGAVTGQPA